jgi:hypothetical protein
VLCRRVARTSEDVAHARHAYTTVFDAVLTGCEPPARRLLSSWRWRTGAGARGSGPLGEAGTARRRARRPPSGAGRPGREGAAATTSSAHVAPRLGDGPAPRGVHDPTSRRDSVRRGGPDRRGAAAPPGNRPRVRRAGRQHATAGPRARRLARLAPGGRASPGGLSGRRRQASWADRPARAAGAPERPPRAPAPQRARDRLVRSLTSCAARSAWGSRPTAPA